MSIELGDSYETERLRWRTLCGACGTPTGRVVYCRDCGAAICPRHTVEQCACQNVDVWDDDYD